MNPTRISTAVVLALALGAGAGFAGSHGMSGGMANGSGGMDASAMDGDQGSGGSMSGDAMGQMEGGMENGMENGMGDAGDMARSGMSGMDRPVYTGKFRDQIYLMDSAKMSLYTFANDKRGVSNCNGDCAVKWPPLLGQPGMKLPRHFSLIQRQDGTWQIAYKKRPLYRWMKDANPGDMTGDGVKGVWHLARP